METINYMACLLDYENTMWIRSRWNPIIVSLRWTDNANGVSNAFWNNFWKNLTGSKMHQWHQEGRGARKKETEHWMEKKVLSAHIYVSTYSSVAFDIVSWPVTSREKIEPILFGLLGHYCFSQHIDHVLIDPAIHLHAQAKNPMFNPCRAHLYYSWAATKWKIWKIQMGKKLDGNKK